MTNNSAEVHVCPASMGACSPDRSSDMFSSRATSPEFFAPSATETGKSDNVGSLEGSRVILPKMNETTIAASRNGVQITILCTFFIFCPCDPSFPCWHRRNVGNVHLFRVNAPISTSWIASRTASYRFVVNVPQGGGVLVKPFLCCKFAQGSNKKHSQTDASVVGSCSPQKVPSTHSLFADRPSAPGPRHGAQRGQSQNRKPSHQGKHRAIVKLADQGAK